MVSKWTWRIAKLAVFMAFITNDSNDAWPQGSWAGWFASLFHYAVIVYIISVLFTIKITVVADDKEPKEGA